jgi:hypothetical protein
MAFVYNQGNPLAGTTSSKPTKAAAAQQVTSTQTKAAPVVTAADKQIASGLGDINKNLNDVLGLVQQYIGGGGSAGVDTSPTGGLTYEQQLLLQKQQQEADRLLAESAKPQLALDTFRATLGLIFGKEEANKSYVSKLLTRNN